MLKRAGRVKSAFNTNNRNGKPISSKKTKTDQKVRLSNQVSNTTTIPVTIKPFGCEFCGKWYKRKNYLKNHLKTHTQANLFTDEQSYVKPFACTICDKKYTGKSNLLYHQRVHTGDKLFACEKCDLKFTFPNSLIYHLKKCRINEHPAFLNRPNMTKNPKIDCV